MYFCSQQHSDESITNSQNNVNSHKPINYTNEEKNISNIAKDEKIKFRELQKAQSQYKSSVAGGINERSERNYNLEFKIQKFLTNINIKSQEECVYLLKNLDTINENYFEVLNKIGDEGNRLE